MSERNPSGQPDKTGPSSAKDRGFDTAERNSAHRELVALIPKISAIIGEFKNKIIPEIRGYVGELPPTFLENIENKILEINLALAVLPSLSEATGNDVSRLMAILQQLIEKVEQEIENKKSTGSGNPPTSPQRAATPPSANPARPTGGEPPHPPEPPNPAEPTVDVDPLGVSDFEREVDDLEDDFDSGILSSKAVEEELDQISRQRRSEFRQLDNYARQRIIQKVQDLRRRIKGSLVEPGIPSVTAGDPETTIPDEPEDVAEAGPVPPDRESLLRELNELWEKLKTNYFAAVNSPQMTGITGSVDRMKELAKFLSSEERKLMEIAFRMRDAAYQESGEDMGRFLAWSNTNPAKEARVKARKIVSADDLRDFRNQHLNIPTGTVDREGRPVTVNLKAIIIKIEREYFNGPYVHTSGEDPHNYAALGNPGENEKKPHKKGAKDCGPIPTILDLVEIDFPETKLLPEFIIDSLDNFIVVSEMRSNSYIPEYAGYQGSPIPGFDGTPAESASPIAACLYKAQSGSAFPKHRVIAAVTRLPEVAKMCSADYNPGDKDEKCIEVTGGKPGYVGEYHANSFGMEEATFSRSRKPENVEMWIRIRNRMIAEFSATSIGYVRLRPDLKIKPTFYDWIKGNWEGSNQPLGRLTYHEFLVTEAAFSDFEQFVDSEFKSPTSTHEVDTAIGLLVDKIRDFKRLFDVLKDDENIFLQVVQLMAIVYLKKVFTSFSNKLKEERKNAGGSRWLKRGGYQTGLSQFYEIAHPIITQSGTLPTPVLEFGNYSLDKVLEDLNKGPIKAPFTRWGAFFTDDLEAKTEGFNRTIERAIEPSFKREYENWMREPKLEEKETGH